MRLIAMAERHIPSLVKIERACFSEPWSENALREELGNPNALFLVCEDTETVLGYIGCHTVLDEGYIANVAVSPAHRRCGVARALVEGLAAAARGRGAAFLTLEVRASNAAALALYTGAGFLAVGTRPRFYTAPVEDAVLMTRRMENGEERHVEENDINRGV